LLEAIALDETTRFIPFLWLEEVAAEPFANNEDNDVLANLYEDVSQL